MFESFRHSNGLLPLMLGVTGHRDLRPEDLPELRKQTTRVLGDIRKRWIKQQGKTSGSLYLLSGMAAGADQLAAECAMEMGIQVVAVLPMLLEQFEDDFSEPNERTHLRDLVSRSSAVVTMPDAGSGRETQYEVAGTYISRNTSLLIALWDGVHVNRIGGTSHVVRMKLFGSDADVDGPLPSLEISTPGPVCHILTPRKSSTIKSNFEIRVLERADVENEILSSTLEKDLSISEAIKRQGQYNADWLRLNPKLGPKAQSGAQNFLPTPPATADEEFLREHYGIADTLASYFQKKSVKFVRCYFTLLLAAGVVLEGGYYYYPMEGTVKEIDPFEVTYALLMLILMGLYWFSKKKDYHNRYHEYRSMAEALRVQLFWRLAGIKDSVADHYMAHQVGDLGWVCKALSAIHLPLFPPQASDFAALREHWVKDQLDFFKKSVKKNAKKSNFWNSAGFAALIVSLFWVVLRIPSHKLYAYYTPESMQIPLAILYVFFAGTSVIAFVFFGYDHFRGFSENAKRQLAMIPLCEMAMRVLSMPISEDSARQVVLQLGREALAENGYWLVMHHQQELDLS